MNVSLPFDKDDTVDRAPWPHVDQSPMRRFKHCVQGIMNLVRGLPLHLPSPNNPSSLTQSVSRLSVLITFRYVGVLL